MSNILIFNVNDQDSNKVNPLQFNNSGSGSTSSVGYPVVNEVLTGVINGTNKGFTTVFIPAVNTESIYINGLLQVRGSDYSISYSNITFTTAPLVGDVLTITYYK